MPLIQIFEEGRKTGAIIMTKDSDFLNLVYEKGIPPQIIWITCGNTSNSILQQILQSTLAEALRLLSQGEEIVEIRDT